MNFTLLNESFNYNSSIQSSQLESKFSITCIFCTNTNTKGLNLDGSFRQCLNCRKQFKCQIKPANNIQNIQSLVNIKPPSTFQILQRPLFIKPNKNIIENSMKTYLLSPNNVYN
jgi:hypothetical protein